jgi:hypothetical protein
MDRKEFNKILRRYDYQRKSSKDEYGDRIYTYTHDEVGVVLTVDQHTVDQHTVDLEGSSWSCYHFEQAAALLVGAVEIGYDKETVLSIWDSLVGGY